MKECILIRLRLSDGSTKVCRATRSPESKTYIAVHKNEQDDKPEFMKLPRTKIYQEDERYLGVFRNLRPALFTKDHTLTLERYPPGTQSNIF